LAIFDFHEARRRYSSDFLPHFADPRRSEIANLEIARFLHLKTKIINLKLNGDAVGLDSGTESTAPSLLVLLVAPPRLIREGIRTTGIKLANLPSSDEEGWPEGPGWSDHDIGFLNNHPPLRGCPP